MQELNAIQNASNLSCDYRKTLALLRALKAGKLHLDAVTMTNDGWTMTEGEPPGVAVADAAEPPEGSE